MALDHTYQLNFGGNMDFKNMLERQRLQSKKISKTQSVTSQIDPRHRRPRRPHRPVRPRAVARRPEVVLHPARGPQLRRRAAQPGAQARGVGLAELGRRHHRRGALRQGRPRPRHRRSAARPVGVLHEVAAGAVPRRRGPRDGRGVRPRRQLESSVARGCPRASIPRSRGPRGEARVRVAPRRSGPRRGAARAGTRAPRRRSGPAATPRNAIT